MQRKYIFLLFLLFQILFLKIIAFFPEFVEEYYSNGLYLFISKINRTVFGFFSFSVGDVLYGILIIYGIYWLYKSRKLHWKQKLLKAVNFLSLFYFLFHFFWGLNYYRVPLFEKMNINREYSDEDLFAFTEKLITKTNALQFAICKNKNTPVAVPYVQDSLFAMAQKGYDKLAQQYPFFKYSNACQKKSLYSLPLTYMGFAGYINPFTNEAQVNCKIPIYGLPNVICHEMAHQIGFGSESECNFIGFLACIKNDNYYFNYSAYSNALRYCMVNIAYRDKKKFELYQSKINIGVLKNFKESDLFWQQYDTFIDKGFHAFYDNFLKLNQQQDGMDSYSKYIDLLVN